MPEKRRQCQAQQLTCFSRCSTEQECGQIHCCSRICSGQSIQEPQRATKIGKRTVSNSIKSTYFHSISTSFHKWPDLFWEQREPPLISPCKFNGLHGAVLRSVGVCSFPGMGFWRLCAGFSEEVTVNPVSGGVSRAAIGTHYRTEEVLWGWKLRKML